MHAGTRQRPTGKRLPSNWAGTLRRPRSGDHALDTAVRFLYNIRTIINSNTKDLRLTPRLELVSLEPEKRTVAKPRVAGRLPNRELRTREHLTPAGVERLIQTAMDNRRGHRDATMILIAFRHGLRASELVDLRWEQTDFEQAVLHVRRVKNGTPATHPLTGRELRALRKLQRESGDNPFVFVSERGTPFSVSGFRRMIERAAQAAGLEIKAHPHMLRHATGYALANQGTDTRTLQAYLGHRSISNTVRYTELAPGRFKNLWKD
jgi:site-specific recombinase XerD